MTGTSQMNLHGGDDVSPIIVDIGCHTARVGYGQEDCPKQWWNSVCGKLLHYTDDNSAQKLLFPLTFHSNQESLEVKPCLYYQGSRYMVNSEVFECIVSRAVEGYIPHNIFNYSSNIDRENEFSGAYTGGLGVRLKEHPVLLSEPSKHSLHIRENMSEVMFEKFQVPALYLAKQAMLSAFAIGRASALIVDIGAAGMTISPVTEGYVIQKGMFDCLAGGDFLDAYIRRSLLTEDKINFIPFYGKKRAAGNEKERRGGTEGDFKSIDLSRTHPSYLQYSQLEVIRDLKESVCKVEERSAALEKMNTMAEKDSKMISKSSFNDKKTSAQKFFELPDGSKVNVEKYEYGVGELLFQPHLVRGASNDRSLQNFNGLPQAIAECIVKCDVDLRRDMLNAIVLTGGTSLMPGLVERVNQSLHEDQSLFSSTVKFKIISPATSIERRFGVWLGGSILASLGTFQQLWISRQEYDEYGMGILEKKCS